MLMSMESVAQDQEFARSRGWKFVDLETMDIPADVLALLTSREARRLEAIPVAVQDRQVAVAVADPGSVEIMTTLRPQFSGRTMRLVYANPILIRRKVEELYSAGSEAARVAKAGDQQPENPINGADFGGGDIGRIRGTDEGNTAKLFNLIVEEALRKKASDIHIEPTENYLDVRIRVDSKLQLLDRYSSEYGAGLVGLIKVGAQMRPDNLRGPDSGVYIFATSGKPVDIRVETAPTAWGQTVTMRLQSEIWRKLSTLGLSEKNEKRYRYLLDQPYGMVLATGPTGSGKTTTLYSSVGEKIHPQVKIITLENPVEYKIPSGVTQISVNNDAGMTFAAGLRSILRQDPDVVLVGEIRDQETAETAVDGAMTGHLVFSTLHTNDAAGVIPRLQRLGIDPFLLSSALLGVIGQRLVRKLCAACKVEVVPTREYLIENGFGHEPVPTQPIFEPKPGGCLSCMEGFSGRVPIHEVLIVDEELQKLISDNADVFEITRAAVEGGMTSMRVDGYEKALLGITSLNEVNVNTRSEMTEDLEPEPARVSSNPAVPLSHEELPADPYQSMHAPQTGKAQTAQTAQTERLRLNPSDTPANIPASDPLGDLLNGLSTSPAASTHVDEYGTEPGHAG